MKGNVIRILVGSVATMGLFLASADTLTWKGGAAGALGTAANWTPEQAPRDGDVLVFPNTVGAVTVENDLTVTLGGLNLASTGALTVNGSQPLKLAGLVTSSATIASATKNYPADRVNCPVELVGDTHFNLTGVPEAQSNPSIAACRNFDIYGCVGGSGDLVVSNRNERGVSLRLYCPTNTYTGRTVLRSFGSGSGRNYAGLSATGSLTDGPSCLGVNRRIDIRGRFSFDADNMVVDRDFVLPWGDAVLQVNKGGGRITATSTISAPAGGSAQLLEFRNTSLTVDAYLSNVQISRNDSGWIYFTNPTNDIRNTNLSVIEGMFVARKLAPMGQPSSFGHTYTRLTLGKNSGSTVGGIGYDGAEDATIDAPIKLDASTFTGTTGARIDSLTAGTTLTVAGDIGVNTSARPHQRLHLRGAGDGVVAGSIEAGVHFVKEDAGTWTIAGETIATTGAIDVAQGTLLVDTAINDAMRLNVASGATLGGTGTIGAPVVFAAGARLKAGAQPLTLAGAVTFPGSLEVDTSDLSAGAVRTVLVCTDPAAQAALASTGFVPSDGDVLATVSGGALTVRRKGAFHWTGAVDATWDGTTANWRTAGGEAAAYVNEENAFFTDDATPADRRGIAVAAGVRAANVTVGGANGWAFSGEPLTVLGTLEKSGAGTFAISNKVDAGLVRIAEGEFTAGRAADLGTSPVTIEAPGTHRLAPDRPVAGALTIGRSGNGAQRTVVEAEASALAVEAAGPVSLVPGSYNVNEETILKVTTPGAVTNRTLNLTTGGGRAILQFAPYSTVKTGDFAWLGDIVCANNPMVYLQANSSGSQTSGDLVIGELGRNTVSGACNLFSLRFGSQQKAVVLNSRVDVTASNGFELNVYAYVKFMAPSNRWGCANLTINSGTAVLMTNDTLDVRHGLTFGASDKGTAASPAWSVVDLNGHDQTLTRIIDDMSAFGSWSESSPNPHSRQVVRSASPATLTLSGDADESRFRYPWSQITGAVTVVKSGRANLLLRQPNANTGSWILQAGTTTIEDSAVQGAAYGGTDLHGTFGASTNVVVGADATVVFRTSRAAFAKGARLTVEPGGKVQMDADQVVDFLTVGNSLKKAGTYTAAKNPEFVQGDGTLTVRVGEGGTMILFR